MERNVLKTRFINRNLVGWSVDRRLQRELHELKAPQERAFRDEETEAVPAESVRSERKST